MVEQIKLLVSIEVHIPPPAPDPTHVLIEEVEELKATISKLKK